MEITVLKVTEGREIIIIYFPFLSYSVRACLWMTFGVFLIALVGVVVFFATNGVKSQHRPGNGCVPDQARGKFCKAAVASDVTQCSEIGRYNECLSNIMSGTLNLFTWYFLNFSCL